MSPCPECVLCPECGQVAYCLSEARRIPPCEHWTYCEMCRLELCEDCIEQVEATC